MSLPKNAKKVFEGVIFDVYQWPQKLYNGTVKTFEAIKRTNTVVIITATKNKMVVLEQQQPGYGWFYSEPAGRIDKGESPKKAAERELLEETGLKAKKLFLWKKLQPSRKIIHTIYVYIAKGCEKVTEQSLDGGEKIKVFELSFEDWLKLSNNPKYINGVTLEWMLRARLDKKVKQELKQALFG
jgi:ADP-ribose pyrophosphatase